MTDVSGGCGKSFELLIVSGAFTGKSLLSRQRLINDLLKSEIQTSIHSISMQTITPEEWQNSNQIDVRNKKE